jgi:hypothetical protein
MSTPKLTLKISDGTTVDTSGSSVFHGTTLDTHPPSLLDGFNAYHAALGGAPGARISDIETVQGGRRVRYEDGAIYEGPTVFAWVHGAIFAHYDQLGGASSWLGLPLTDETDMSEGGRASVFDRGTIYWWPDVGAIDLNEVVVHYTGLMCFGETDIDGGSDADEPFVTVGVVTPSGGNQIQSQIYLDVDGGESRPDLIELYRGLPQGMTLTVVLADQDHGDPNKYRAVVGQAVDKGMEKLVPIIANAVGGVPVVGPVLAFAASNGLPLLVPTISDFLNDLLGTGDDFLGTEVMNITAKDMVVLSARTENFVHQDIGFKVESPLMSRLGASYKVFFGMAPA